VSTSQFYFEPILLWIRVVFATSPFPVVLTELVSSLGEGVSYMGETREAREIEAVEREFFFLISYAQAISIWVAQSVATSILLGKYQTFLLHVRSIYLI
jgi:hypothetical protein